jgi:hypothetical protein
LALLQGRPHWVFLALILLLPGIAMSLFQPVNRYAYLFYGMLVFTTADFAAAAWALARTYGGRMHQGGGKINELSTSSQ